MTWARLDDKFHGHRKVKRAWKKCRAAIGLHVMAIAYCADHATDGFVDDEFVEEKLPKPAELRAAVAALVDAGMWVEDVGGWRIHDFLEFNPSRAEADAKRDAKRRAGSLGAQARWQGGSSRRSGGVAPATPLVGRGNAPVPTRPEDPPVPPKGGRARDKERFEEEFQAFASSVLPHLPEEGAYYGAKEAFTMLRNRGSLRPSREQVLGYLRENRPDLMEAAA